MKKITDPIEIRQAVTRFGYRHNINMVTVWHNSLFISINKGIEELEDQLKKSDERKMRIPEQIATPFRLNPPPCSDLNRHPIPEQIATPYNGV